MNESSKSCRQCRQALSVGDVRPADLHAFQAHLADCPECRSYLKDVTNLSEGMIAWRNSLAHIEPSARARSRWAAAVKDSQPSRPFRPVAALAYWWQDLVYPYRQAWAGIALVWVVMWAINWERPSQPSSALHANVRPAPAALQAFNEQRRLLAELIPGEPAPSKPSPPQPRSELPVLWKTT